jgi:signal transduction histidine kinase
MVQPVTAALAMLEMLVTGESLTPVGQELAERMQRALNKVGLMTAREPDEHAGMTADPSACLRIEHVVREAVETTQAAFDSAGVKLRYDCGPDIPPVSGDAHDLGRVFMNLLVNAREALAGRIGAVHVTVEAAPGASGERVVVRVRDNGPGIPDTIRARAFQPDISTKGPRRRGLGLAICREIVERHGGSIEVERAEACGSSFCVMLPAARQPTKPA